MSVQLSKNYNDGDHVQFISYTGEYPNLCSGVLTLKIDGELVRFGHDYRVFESYKTDGNYDSFWVTGGRTYFSNDWSESYIETDEWVVYEEDLPEKFRKYVHEIEAVINENIPYGCCGGCL